jgi:hypothetical protein
MEQNHDITLIWCIGIGLSLATLGLGHLLVSKKNVVGRVLVALLASTILVGVVGLVVEPALKLVLGIAAGLFLFKLVIVIPMIRRTMAGLLNRLGSFAVRFSHPQVRASLYLVGAIGLTTGGAIWHQQRSEEIDNATVQEFQIQHEVTMANAITLRNTAKSDLGHRIELKKPADSLVHADSEIAEEKWLRQSPIKDKVIHREKANPNSNCHGWVFTGGRFIVGGNEVDLILTDNHYETVSQPNVNDLIIYRDNEGHVSHTAIVRAILNDGSILVEGKWGALGVYLHEVKDSCYGTNFKFYHTDRGSHLIEGLDEVTE